MEQTSEIRLIKHAPGAPGLRFFGLGPNLTPSQGLLKLQQLIQEEKSLKNIFFYSLVDQLPISEFSSNPPSELSAPKVQISKFLNLPGYLYL